MKKPCGYAAGLTDAAAAILSSLEPKVIERRPVASMRR
jgi:hypothetical protein